MTLDVTDNQALHRYEVTVDGQTATLVYRRSPENITLVHTIVPDEMAGRGAGSTLARYALETARAKGEVVIVECPFVTAFLGKHPEYMHATVRLAKKYS